MRKELALALEKKAEEIAKNFSRSDRKMNYGNETFSVEEIIPLSESTAIIEFSKNTGKKAVVIAYHTNSMGGKWNYFFPTYDHCVGFEKVREYLHEVEQKNFPLNFVTKNNQQLINL